MTPLSPTKILFVGDMHLGRRASRVPDAVSSGGGPAIEELGPVAALKRAVQWACDEEVQAMAFAGDLVHAESNLFEARRQLEDCLKPLHAAGIVPVAVAGNHDTGIMPLLADTIAGLQLLGRDGTWSSCDVAPGVRIVGWSFPQSHHTESPLLQDPPAPVPGTITIGLLHADLDTSGSRYAPVTTSELLNVGYDGWALGHIHAPDPVPAPGATGRPFYLGSLGAVPPTETGAHGPVLMTVTPDGDIRWERRNIAPLRWEQLELAADDLPQDLTAEEMVSALRKHLFAFAEANVPPPAPDSPLLALGLRITLTGTHPAAHILPGALEKLQGQDMAWPVEGCWIFIDKLSAKVNAPLDLAALAQRQDPPGLLARRLVALEAHDPAVEPLVRQAKQRFDEIALPREYASEAATSQDARDYLIQSGRQALNALLAQNSEGVS